MTTSGTYTFAPSIGSLAQYAFGLCGIRRTELTPEHLTDAYMGANLLLSTWGNSTPNLWRVSEVIQTLVDGINTYDVSANCIMILDAFIVYPNNVNGNPTSRLIWPISRTEWAATPNKLQPGAPTTFWFDRLLAPTITIWPVPTTGYGDLGELHYYQVSQIQDASLANGQTLDLPEWWLMAFAVGLAEMLSISYAPDRTAGLAAKAAQVLAEARAQNIENVPLIIAPSIYQYYVRR